jgi:hypothetical protein
MYLIKYMASIDVYILIDLSSSNIIGMYSLKKEAMRDMLDLIFA